MPDDDRLDPRASAEAEPNGAKFAAGLSVSSGWPFARSELALYGSIFAFGEALLCQQAPLLLPEDFAALLYFHTYHRVTGTTISIGGSSREHRALVAAYVLVNAVEPLLEAVGWTTRAMTVRVAGRAVVFAVVRWTRGPRAHELHRFGVRVGRKTVTVKEWDAERRRTFVAEVLALLKQIGRVHRAAVARGLVQPHDKTDVLGELVAGGYPAGPRTARSVLRFDADGLPRLDERAVLRRLRRRQQFGTPPTGTRAPSRAAEVLDPSGCLAPRRPQEAPPGLAPEVPPPIGVEDEVAARRYDGLRHAADLIARAAKTNRERDFLAAYALDDVDTYAEAAGVIGCAPSTGRTFLGRIKRRSVPR